MADVDPDFVARLTAEITAQVLQRVGPMRAAAPEPSKVERTVAELYAEYLGTLRGKSLRQRTHQGAHLRRAFAFQGRQVKLEDLKPSECSPALLQAWVQMLEATRAQNSTQPLAPGTVDQIRMALQSCFKLHIARGELADNPLRKVKRDKRRLRQRVGYYTPQELETQAEAMPQMGGIILRHLYRTCMRLDNLRTLRKHQINWTTGKVDIVVKGGRQESVQVPDDILAEMKALCAVSPGEYVYPNPRRPHEPLSEHTLRNWNRKARKATGIVLPGGERPTYHHARHTGALAMLDAGADITEVQKQLTHVSINETARYLKARDRRDQRIRTALNDVAKLK